ncbi:ASCH domain-containing protein [Chelativorans sp. M5D2P16]|uniref:ASCH domain-containing protein n=1 Tax=Chelativorans sp. M5D2P16 TaxID=3095678 RepID=UPI002ACAE1D5|nr:ASCH domain-containing protein [Chelativorans sp. M5D2P16]MDZ5698934.1 ASCH domain-containing protein [Chelativorans sp. M5D2P16]
MEPADEAVLGEEEAQSAGFASLDELRHDLRDGEGRSLYRIELCGIEVDRRVPLRQESALAPQEAAAIEEKLSRWDKANGRKGYHRAILDAIAAGGGVAAARIAEQLGVEKLKLKRDVRKLKELGLTESLDVGYGLSPRGRALLAILEARR